MASDADGNVFKTIAAIFGGGGGKAVTAAADETMTPYQRFEASLAEKKLAESAKETQQKLAEKQAEFFQKEMDRRAQLGISSGTLLNTERQNIARSRYDLLNLYANLQKERMSRFDAQTKMILEGMKPTDQDKAKANLLADFLRAAQHLHGTYAGGRIPEDAVKTILSQASDKSMRENYYQNLTPYQVAELQRKLQEFGAIQEPSARAKELTKSLGDLALLQRAIDQGTMHSPDQMASFFNQREKEAKPFMYDPSEAAKFAEANLMYERAGDVGLHPITLPTTR